VPALLVVGLGNPGPRFDGTRHNVGFAVVEAVAERLQLRFRKPLFARYRATRIERRSDGLALAEPLTYMNNSGQVFPSLLRRYRVTSEGLLVVCDNLDLPPGRVRLKRGGGSAGHNGLSSIVKALGHGEVVQNPAASSSTYSASHPRTSARFTMRRFPEAWMPSFRFGSRVSTRS
jgi:PTH1 family peptidyl-tRNA hydrolase